MKYIDPAGLERFDPSDDARADYHDSKRKSHARKHHPPRRGDIGLPDPLTIPNVAGGYPYGNGLIFLVTPIHFSKDGRIGVAVGYYATFDYGPGVPMYTNHGYGLVIFFFDEEGELIYLYFVPFEDFDNEKKMVKHARWVRTLLKHMEISLTSLKQGLRNLRDYCGARDNFYGYSAGGTTLVGVGAFLLECTNPIGLGALALVGSATTLEALKWDSWFDKIVEFMDYLDQLKP